jgi:hypothetical protein
MSLCPGQSIISVVLWKTIETKVQVAKEPVMATVGEKKESMQGD